MTYYLHHWLLMSKYFKLSSILLVIFSLSSTGRSRIATIATDVVIFSSNCTDETFAPPPIGKGMCVGLWLVNDAKTFTRYVQGVRSYQCVSALSSKVCEVVLFEREELCQKRSWVRIVKKIAHQRALAWWRLWVSLLKNWLSLCLVWFSVEWHNSELGTKRQPHREFISRTRRKARERTWELDISLPCLAVRFLAEHHISPEIVELMSNFTGLIKARENNSSDRFLLSYRDANVGLTIHYQFTFKDTVYAADRRCFISCWESHFANLINYLRWAEELGKEDWQHFRSSFYHWQNVFGILANSYSTWPQVRVHSRCSVYGQSMCKVILILKCNVFSSSFTKLR